MTDTTVPHGVYARVYWKGWNDFLKNGFEAKNPYAKDTPDGEDWLTGWVASQAYQDARTDAELQAKAVKTAKQARHAQNVKARADANRQRASKK